MASISARDTPITSLVSPITGVVATKIVCIFIQLACGMTSPVQQSLALLSSSNVRLDMSLLLSLAEVFCLPHVSFSDFSAVCRSGCFQGTCDNQPGACNCNGGWTGERCDAGKIPLTLFTHEQPSAPHIASMVVSALRLESAPAHLNSGRVILVSSV